MLVAIICRWDYPYTMSLRELCGSSTAHGLCVHEPKAPPPPLSLSLSLFPNGSLKFEVIPFSDRECRDNFRIELVICVVDGQISRDRASNRSQYINVSQHTVLKALIKCVYIYICTYICTVYNSLAVYRIAH
jgi:hypothetical protein